VPDSDEFFFCPQAGEDVASQRKYQQRIMGDFSALGVEEMRFVRLPYSGLYVNYDTHTGIQIIANRGLSAALRLNFHVTPLATEKRILPPTR
jgi:hypothetical protein